VSELYGVDGHDPAMAEIALPLLVSILVVDAVLDVVREQVFQLDRRPKPKAQLGVFPPGHRSVCHADRERRCSPLGEIICVNLHGSMKTEGRLVLICMWTFDGEDLPLWQIIVTYRV
jgi:hypothetical protein